MFKVLILILTLFSIVNASPEQIQKDFDSRNIEKFQNDNFETAAPHKMIEAGILKQDFTTTQAGTSIDCNSFMTSSYTSTVYNIDALNGTVQCMWSQKAENEVYTSLYAPRGLFIVEYPAIKERFKLNNDLAKQQNASIIAQKNSMTRSLIETKNEISRSITEADGTYLNVTELILAAVLADPNVINAAATETTGRLQLQGDYTSQYTSETGDVNNNGNVIKNEVVSIFKGYAVISSSILEYLFVMIVFVAMFTAGRMAILKLNKHDRSVALKSFGAVALIGFIGFFPMSSSSGAPGQNPEDEFAVIDSNWQSVTRKGYYLFSNLADSMALKLINSSLDNLLNKSGIGTSNQIIQAAAGATQAQALINYHTQLKSSCVAIYDSEYIDASFNKSPNSIYPRSENWASAIAGGGAPAAQKNYYNKSPEGLVRGNVDFGSYPAVSFSFCNRNDNLIAKYQQQHKDYTDSFNKAIETDPRADQKITILTALVRFQYQLYREWGWVSILGLPVTMLQTETAGRLYETDDVSKKLKERISSSDETGGFISSFVASIPYMLVPGASSIFDNTVGTLRDLGSGARDTVVGRAFSLIGGNIAASLAVNSAGFALSLTLTKILLSLLPITGIVIIGLLRVITIIIKIFVFHFGSIVLFPILFTQNNHEYISKFMVKVLLLMVEIPVFVLSVWLAITANSLLHSIGDVFSKEIILGMLANSEAGRVKEWNLAGLIDMSQEFFEGLKIFLLNGFMEVVIALFSIIIIYKIIISLHSALFEGMELRGTQILDDAVASLRNEQSFQGKI